MSVDVLFSQPKLTDSQLFLFIMEHVVPLIVDQSQPLMRRTAVAWTWFRYLCRVRRGRCRDDVPRDIGEWDENTLIRVAEELIDYAAGLRSKDYATASNSRRLGEHLAGKTTVW